MNKKLKIIYTETYRVTKYFEEEIDIQSTTQWQALIEKVRPHLTDEDSLLAELPIEPSADLNEWLSLYFYLDGKEYKHAPKHHDNEIQSEVTGRTWTINNDRGEVLAEDASEFY